MLLAPRKPMREQERGLRHIRNPMRPLLMETRYQYTRPQVMT